MTRLRLVIPILLVAFAVTGVSTASARTARINLGDDFFSPTSKTVSKGTKLKFVWTGKDKHNVVATGAANKRSEVKKTGTFSFKARKKGTINLVCEIHEDDMKATVTVN
jgi:plastocyanin